MANLDQAGPIPFDAGDIDFARALQQTLDPRNIEEAFQAAGVEPRDMPLADFVMPLQLDNKGGGIPLGSTDVGDVSWAVPLVHLNATTVAFGTPLHTWQMVGQGKSGIAHKGMVHAATMMAATAVDLFCDRGLLEDASAEHARTLAKTPYVTAIPADVVPPIVERPANP